MTYRSGQPSLSLFLSVIQMVSTCTCLDNITCIAQYLNRYHNCVSLVFFRALDGFVIDIKLVLSDGINKFAFKFVDMLQSCATVCNVCSSD